jgi:tRNA-splicing ligase RtcB (3'-phosphate/5'-hydroxy nucleic acid ligase)
MSNYSVIPGKLPIFLFNKGVEVEDDAIAQLKNLSDLPFVHHHIAVMPDCHSGKGSTIGTVIPTERAIIPAAVGVDLGCGMMAAKTNLSANELPDNLASLRSAIESAVPHGRTNNGGAGDRGAWHDIPDVSANVWDGQMKSEWDKLIAKYPLLNRGSVNHINHLGTLGTGNHFIEVCKDENDCIWLMLHSGSRGVGNRIGSFFIEKAKEDMARYFINLPDKDLAYIPEGSDYFKDYCDAVLWAQEFARQNRELIMDATIKSLSKFILPALLKIDDPIINCHHNYISKESHYGKNVWVTRKGAVRARAGDMGIIPGSMGVGSYIVRGKGNAESFSSCSHGAGRRMSRTKARNTISLADHEKATAGIECRKDADVLDESPGAYKNLDAVMAAQSDLIEIVHKLTPLVCVKG